MKTTRPSRSRVFFAIFILFLLALSVLRILLSSFFDIFVVSLFTKALTHNPDTNVFSFYAAGSFTQLAVAEIFSLCVLTLFVRQRKHRTR